MKRVTEKMFSPSVAGSSSFNMTTDDGRELYIFSSPTRYGVMYNRFVVIEARTIRELNRKLNRWVSL